MIFLDTWRSEKAQNYVTLFKARGISEDTIREFASLFWSKSALAQQATVREILEAHRNAEEE